MSIQKVTDPAKITTDPAVLTELQRQGINSDYVEFHKDYNAKYPYSKVYKDLKSDKLFQVISQLPKVRKDGIKIESEWYLQGNKYKNKTNLFNAVVDDMEVSITALNDQPNGNTKKNDSVTWNPQLFIADIEQFPISLTPAILSVDLINEEYHNNTLEWDYTVCKRRIRIIEGRIREKWVFNKKPAGAIRIKHNHSGELKLNFGRGKVCEGKIVPLPIEVLNDDEEVLSNLDFDYPLEIGASPETFYPDADPESSSVDGYVGMQSQNDTFINVRAMAGNVAIDDGTVLVWQAGCSTTSGNFTDIYRGIVVFNTAALPDDCTIIAATITLTSQGCYDGCSADPNFQTTFTSIWTSSDNALSASDYDNTNFVSYSDTVEWDAPGANVWTLNSTGRGQIMKSGKTKYMWMDSLYDRGFNAFPWVYGESSWVQVKSAEQGGSYRPKLIVTYTVPPGQPLGIRKRGRILGLGTNRPS